VFLWKEKLRRQLTAEDRNEAPPGNFVLVEMHSSLGRRQMKSVADEVPEIMAMVGLVYQGLNKPRLAVDDFPVVDTVAAGGIQVRLVAEAPGKVPASHPHAQLSADMRIVLQECYKAEGAAAGK